MGELLRLLSPFRLLSPIFTRAREDFEKFLVMLAKGKVFPWFMKYVDPMIMSLAGMYDRLVFRRPSPVEIRNVMVYSHNIGGHRHIYAKKFIDYYSRKGFQVYLVFRGLFVNSRKFLRYNSRHMESHRDNPSIHMIDISDPSFGLEDDVSDPMRFIVKVQRKYDIDLTVFIDGDGLYGRFARQVLPWGPKLIGKNYAVFILSEFIHEESKARRRGQAFFHLFLMRYFGLLDGGLYSDENIVDVARCPRHIHLPEVGNSELPPDDDEERNAFYARVIRNYKEFLREHEGKEVILSFGDLELRKGFDLLLKLAAANEDLVLVRCGRTKLGYTPDWESILNKEKLIRQGRLFELDSYVEDQGLFDALYQSVDYFILAYKDFYRTSSVMLQALHYTKPVLVPNVGLMRDRVLRNGLGRTFENLSYESLRDEHAKLRGETHKYHENIRKYIRENFTGDCYDAIFEKTLTLRDNSEKTKMPFIEALEPV